jgi:hypothetical protein
VEAGGWVNSKVWGVVLVRVVSFFLPLGGLGVLGLLAVQMTVHELPLRRWLCAVDASLQSTMRTIHMLFWCMTTAWWGPESGDVLAQFPLCPPNIDARSNKEE